MEAAIPMDEAPPLPAAYAAFAPVLDRLSDPMRRLLYGQLAQFERLMMRFDLPEVAHRGEFEGMGGLTVRGDIAHIVQSELLLRDEAPLEFLRRIAEAETLYLERRYVDPGVKPVYRAMISVGPGILGHGRLVALAALFFMARLAARRDAAFHWCFLPRADGAVWFEGISLNSVKRLLKAASHREIQPDDVADAHRIWAGLQAERDARVERDPIDWILGARRRGQGEAAVDEAANALIFSLLPPRRAEPRATHLLVRQRGREQGRVTILFPDDVVCVSALKQPFRPLKPQPMSGAAGGSRPKPTGWEPRYFSVPDARTKIVRLETGLLVLIDGDGTDRYARPIFIPVADDVDLVGISVLRDQIHLAVCTTAGGRDVILYRYHRTSAAGRELLLQRMKEVPTRHLFKGRDRYAIPPMSIDIGARFYSRSGAEFYLGFSSKDTETKFEMRHTAPRTLHSDGVVRVIWIEQAGGPVLRVLKHSAKWLADHVAPAQAIAPDALYGMVYSPSDKSLAYSLSRNIWTIAPTAPKAGTAKPVAPPVGRTAPVTVPARSGYSMAYSVNDSGIAGNQRPIPAPAAASAVTASDDQEAQQLRLAPHETLLMARVVGGVLSARIWSDARYGGDGTVRTIRREFGEEVVRQPVLRLGADALSIVKIVQADDGIWALTVDEQGAPAELLHYRMGKRKSHHVCTRLPLAPLRDRAVVIDLAVDDD